MKAILDNIKTLHSQLVSEGFDKENKDEMRKQLLDMYRSSDFETVPGDKLIQAIDLFIRREYRQPLDVKRLIPFDTSLFMYSVHLGLL